MHSLANALLAHPIMRHFTLVHSSMHGNQSPKKHPHYDPFNAHVASTYVNVLLAFDLSSYALKDNYPWTHPLLPPIHNAPLHDIGTICKWIDLDIPPSKMKSLLVTIFINAIKLTHIYCTKQKKAWQTPSSNSFRLAPSQYIHCRTTFW